LAALWLGLPAQAANHNRPDYPLRAVPPALTADAATTFLVDWSAPKTRADKAAGSGELALTGTTWTAGSGLSGPFTFQGPGNLDPASFTVELVLRFRPGPGPDALGGWSAPGNYTASLKASGFQLSGQGGRAGRAGDFSLSQPFGVNGASAARDGLGQWLYIAFGADLDRGLHGSAVRDVKGDLLNRLMRFGWQDQVRLGGPADSPDRDGAEARAWAEMAASVRAAAQKGLPSTITLGSPRADILTLRISKGFRSDILQPHPDPIEKEALRTARAGDLEPLRVETNRVRRALGYAGYHNSATVSIPEESHVLKPGASATLELGVLPVGLYSLHLYGTIDPNGRTNLNRVWNPCPMEFEAVDGNGRQAAFGRRLLKQSFDPVRLQGFDFHVTTPGTYTATFRVMDSAKETARVQRVVFLDRLQGLPDAAVKTSQNLEPGRGGQLAELTEARKQRDTAIWGALPPLNVHLQVHDQEKSFRQPPAGIPPSPWAAVSDFKSGTTNRASNHVAARQALAPLDLVNARTGETFSQADLLAGKPLPGDRGDDGTGLFFTRAEFPTLPHDIYYAPRAVLLGTRIRYYLGLLGAGDNGGNSLPALYAEAGDPETGHDAALALVRLAYDWPALEMNLHEQRLCTHSPDLEFNMAWSENRNGKYFYEGWSGANAASLLKAYDQVFPYIRSNAVFAAAVHRFVPWVNTPEDVIRLIDRRLVFASVRDLHSGLIRAAPVEDLAAQVLGPHPLTAPMMDLTRAWLELYPYEGTYQELYASALSRSGVYHIGSFMTYAFGSALDTVDKASMLAAARAKGVPLPLDLSDLRRFPKVRSAADFMIDMWVAGGFPMMVGDASGGPHSPAEAKKRLLAARPILGKAYSLTGDKRYAWLLANLCGETNAALLAAAAAAVDPILHNHSRVVPDYAAILEEGVGSSSLEEKTAATLRIGVGQGHAHSDYLDLNLFAMGLPLAVDLACRNEGDNWSRPGAAWPFLHNHAMAHDTDNPRDAGQEGDPWLRQFSPPLVRTAYEDASGEKRLLRDSILMTVGDTGACYMFDLQRLSGGAFHTWCFHGCESDGLALNSPMTPATNRWTDRLLEGTTYAGKAGDSLQAVWTMTRAPRTVEHRFNGGGAIKLVACEQAVLGPRYDAARPEANIRATLLGCSGSLVMQGNPYSERYQYAFPFLWVQHDGARESLYPAIYEWYRGASAVVERATLVSREPLTVNVRLVNGQSDTYTVTPEAFSAVSRDAAGVRWIKLAGAQDLREGELSVTLKPAAAEARITAIDYAARTLSVDRPLPANPSATIGNPGRRIFLKLNGSGTQFSWDDDLLAHEGRLTSVTVTGPDTVTLATSQPLFKAGLGNRKPGGYTVVSEDGAWHFRDGKVIRRPAGGVLAETVFTDANGDGFVNVKTYEIGLGDMVDVPSAATVERTASGYRILANAEIDLRIGSVSLRGDATEKPVEFKIGTDK
jgi:hypothetical protein